MDRWEKRGRIFLPDGSLSWMRSHASQPVADLLDETRLRIYFASRDDQNRSRIGWINVARDNPATVLEISREPILPLGQKGTFDDSGMMPSCIVPAEGRKYLFYVGWNIQVTVPYRHAIGLAVSEDDGRTFHRFSLGPLLDRDRDEPFFNTAPCVLREGSSWKMWYTSCTGWAEIQGHLEPMYHVKYAESEDGVSWRRTGIVCVDYDDVSHAIGRPWVVRRGDGYGMWFSYRGLVDFRTDPQSSYRIGYAESLDGLRWERQSDPVGLARSAEGWDSLMAEYAQVLPIRGRWHCFYNGNGFGQSGLGYAVAIEAAVIGRRGGR